MTSSQQWVDPFGQIDTHPEAAFLATAVGQICSMPEYIERSQALLPLLALQPGETVLEVGCGAGAVVRELARLTGGTVRITAVDLSQRTLDVAVRDTDAAGLGDLAQTIIFQQMDGRALTFPDATFDAAFCSRVLNHAPEPERIVREMARVVRPGGRVLAIEQANRCMAGVDDALVVKTLGFTSFEVGREVPGMFRRAGLREVSITPHMIVDTVPPNMQALREEFAAGGGLRAMAVREGRCTAQEVQSLFDQMERSIERQAYVTYAVHFAALGYKE